MCVEELIGNSILGGPRCMRSVDKGVQVCRNASVCSLQYIVWNFCKLFPPNNNILVIHCHNNNITMYNDHLGHHSKRIQQFTEGIFHRLQINKM